MEKIPSLFVRDHTLEVPALDQVTPGCEWVQRGEGIATEKFDGTACRIFDGALWRRYDRRPTKQAKRRGPPFVESDYTPLSFAISAAQESPDEVTGHWPGWKRINQDDPNDKWHVEALKAMLDASAEESGGEPVRGPTHVSVTYELVGPKVQGNPYKLESHELWRHGSLRVLPPGDAAPTDYKQLCNVLALLPIEGFVWHHPDGRMCKIKRKDFGLPWPV